MKNSERILEKIMINTLKNNLVYEAKKNRLIKKKGRLKTKKKRNPNEIPA